MNGKVKVTVAGLIMLLFAVAVAAAQEIAHPDTEPWSSSVPYSQLDPQNYNPDREPDIDLRHAHWRESLPVLTHGGFAERPIFTAGDPLEPAGDGAVLGTVERFVHVTLRQHTSTRPMTLEGRQEIYYVLSGTGTVHGDAVTHGIHEGMVVLVPEGLEYRFTNTGDVPVMMYLVVEPVPEDFTPIDYIVVKDAEDIPVTTDHAHWNNSVRHLLTPAEGLASLEECCLLSLPPRSMSQPFSFVRGVEAVYAGLEGSPLFLSGKQIRRLTPGGAYMPIPDGVSPHANINLGEFPVSWFYFASFDEQAAGE